MITICNKSRERFIYLLTVQQHKQQHLCQEAEESEREIKEVAIYIIIVCAFIVQIVPIMAFSVQQQDQGNCYLNGYK